MSVSHLREQHYTCRCSQCNLISHFVVTLVKYKKECLLVKLKDTDLWFPIWHRYTDIGVIVNVFRCENLTNNTINIQMSGNEGILSYINMTSRGQSGGAVLQTRTDLCYRIQPPRLIGIHVSGYSEQSKCTLIVQPNYDWIKSILISDNTGYEVVDWQDRMLTFMNKFEQLSENERQFEITDIECFPLISKMICMMSENKSHIDCIKIDLELNKLNKEKDKITKRIQYLTHIAVSLSITELNLRKTYVGNTGFKILSENLKYMKSLETLNLSKCSIESIETKQLFFLQDSEIRNLDLSHNRFGDGGFLELCMNLTKTKIINLNIQTCSIYHITPIANILHQTQIESLNLERNTFNNEGLIDLCLNLKDSQVKRLNLRACFFNDCTPLIDCLPETQIQNLNMSRNWINHLKDFMISLTNSKVTTLKLFSTGFDYIDPLIEYLPQTNIQDLDLTEIRVTYIETNDFTNLCSILENTSIKKLNMKKCDKIDVTMYINQCSKLGIELEY